MCRVAAALFIVGLAGPAIAQPAPISPDRIRVIDGDTVRIDRAQPDYRLVGFNTPETRRAKSQHERNLGQIATFRLREIIRSGGALTFEEVVCACRPGTHGTDRCNFGRKCGTLRINGRDVGDVLISEGLAVPFVCGPTSCPKMPAPWRDEK